MNTQPRPGRHEVGFSFSDASKARADDLLRKCGHNDLRLLMARGLALVEWVEQQHEEGRVVAGVLYAKDEESEMVVVELEERPDLLRPKVHPRPVLVPASPAPVAKAAPVSVAPPVTAQVVVPVPAPVAVEPEPEPAPVVLDPDAKREALRLLVEQNPKLMARPKVPPQRTEPKPSRASMNRRAELMMAHKVNDAGGPIKSFEWVRAHCITRSKMPPICFRDRPLPGELAASYLEHFDAATDIDSRVSHFRINDCGDLMFYAFLVGKGWCQLELGTVGLYKDAQVDAGIACVFPIALAADYLREGGKVAFETPPEPDASFDIPHF